MKYKVTLLVKTVQPYASIKDFLRELELFEQANKGVIELSKVETEALDD